MDPNENQPNQGPISQGIDFLNNSRAVARWGRRARHPMETLNALRGALGVGHAAAGVSGAAAGGVEAGATAGAGALAGPAVGVGIAVLILVVVVIIFSGAAPNITVAGEPTDSGDPSASFSPGPMPTPGASVDPSSAVAKLKSDFNITIIGGTPQQIASIYNYLSIYLSYPIFTSKIKSASPTITISNTQPGGADAFTNTSGDVTIFTNFWTRGDYTQKKYLIHEFAHTMGNTGQEQLQRDLYTQVHDAGKDSLCFASYGIIKTYTPTNSSPNVIHETFAESVADTIMCDSGTCGGPGKGGGTPIQNFPKTCGNTYRFIRTNVLK